MDFNNFQMNADSWHFFSRAVPSALKLKTYTYCLFEIKYNLLPISYNYCISNIYKQYVSKETYKEI